MPNFWIFAISYFISCIIHELAHYIFFRCFGLAVIEISFGIFRMSFVDGCIIPKCTLSKPFDFSCSCENIQSVSRCKRNICLLAGGLINLVCALILALFIIWVEIQCIKVVICIQIISCIANVFINIVNPYSKDRKLIRELNDTGV